MRECWYKNNTANDLNLRTELGFKIPAYATVNLYKLKPSLTEAEVAKSESEGLINKCVRANKLIKLPFAPPPPQNTLPEVISEAKKPVPSRTKSSVVMDLEEMDYIEDLEGEFRADMRSAEKYADYADGVSDPIILESDRESFDAVVVPSGEPEEPLGAPSEGMKMKTGQVGHGNNRYLIVEPDGE